MTAAAFVLGWVAGMAATIALVVPGIAAANRRRDTGDPYVILDEQ